MSKIVLGACLLVCAGCGNGATLPWDGAGELRISGKVEAPRPLEPLYSENGYSFFYANGLGEVAVSGESAKSFAVYNVVLDEASRRELLQRISWDDWGDLSGEWGQTGLVDDASLIKLRSSVMGYEQLLVCHASCATSDVPSGLRRLVASYDETLAWLRSLGSRATGGVRVVVREDFAENYPMGFYDWPLDRELLIAAAYGSAEYEIGTSMLIDGAAAVVLRELRNRWEAEQYFAGGSLRVPVVIDNEHYFSIAIRDVTPFEDATGIVR